MLAPQRQQDGKIKMEKTNKNEDDQGNAVTAKEVAENILLWAKKHNLFSKVPVEEAIESEDFDREMVPQQMFSAVGVEDILRKRSINLVTYNEADRKVVIFTNSKVNQTEKKLLPFSTKNSIQIEYATGGIAQVKGSPTHPDKTLPYTMHKSKYYSCGSSIYPVNCQGAGTLGALARNEAGDIYGITNNHVSGACNNALPGLPILAPGPLDANEDGIDPFTIGRHEKLLPINDGIPENIDITQNYDVAIFKIADSSRLSSMQGDNYDTPANCINPVAGMRVQKYGRTTGLTEGQIIGISASPVPVMYNLREYSIKKTVYFNDVFVIQGNDGAMFSKPGDSGSLVVGFNEKGERIAVGIVFAGNEGRGISFMLSLPKMLHHFGLTLLSGHNI